MDKNESLSEEGEQIQASKRLRRPPKTRVKVNKKIYKPCLRKNNGVWLSPYFIMDVICKLGQYDSIICIQSFLFVIFGERKFICLPSVHYFTFSFLV